MFTGRRLLQTSNNRTPQATETEKEQLTAALGAARRERAALETIHGSLVLTERYQSDMLQAAQMVEPPRTAAGEHQGHWCKAPQAELPAPPAAKPVGFLKALGEWSQRQAAHIKSIFREGVFGLLQWGGYVPTDADFRCVGRRRRRR